MIKFFKNIFSKKESPITNQKQSDKDDFIESMKESDLSISEKINLIIKSKFYLSNEELHDNAELTIDYGSDYDDLQGLIIELEHEFNIKIQEGAFLLTVGEIKEYVKKKIEDSNYTVSDENSYINSWPLTSEQMLYLEHLMSRSKAIKELLNNNYMPLENGYGNQFIEPITFTLQYFENYIKEKPVDAVVQLSRSFPLMHQFIHRQITKQEHTILIEDYFDEQQAYDEFLLFCKSYFLSFYPIKNERDLQISRHFKLITNSLIQFIDDEQTD